MNTVLFDPGLGDLVLDLNDYVNKIYSSMMQLQSIKQKRTKFKLFASKIEKYIKNNIAFYYGCLLWAYYITTTNKENQKEITGNIFSVLNEEQIKNYDYMLQVNFLENYFDSYERDVLYYTGRKYLIPEQWKKILRLYTEFLENNKGFIHIKYTSDIILPSILKNIKVNFNIEEKITQVIANKDIESLLNNEFFIL